MNFQSGAFGDPTQLQTLILFWTKMELLHYPGAGETRTYLEEELKRQQQVREAVVSSGLSLERRENPGGAIGPGGIFPESEGLDPRREQA